MADRALRTRGPGTVAHARESFLGQDSTGGDDVRRLILTSWERSQQNNVDSDQVAVPYLRVPDLESPLARSAAPILDSLHEQLSGEPVSIVLTDQTGMIVDRRTGAASIAQRLDAVRLAPGFSYAEEHAGTNGIGTTLSTARPTFVDGREHYTGELGQFCCAGAPIHHPTHHRVIGVLDLTTWTQTSATMLMALANATARQIEEELLAQTGLREFALFRAYLEACRGGGAVLALNNDAMMMNDHLRRLLDSSDQHALLGYAAELMTTPRAATRTVELPGGSLATIRCTPATTGSGPAGGVFHVRLVRPVRAAGGTTGAGHTPVLPGLVGSSAAWSRCVQQALACYAAGDWLVVRGEPGSGKQSLLLAAHRQLNPAGRWRSAPPPEPDRLPEWLAGIVEEIAVPGTMMVIPQADRLDDAAVAALLDSLQENADDDGDPAMRSRVALILDTPYENEAVESLLSMFPRSIDVPALRHRPEDVAELVPHLLAMVGRAETLECSPAALRMLQRCVWPGNITQLRRVLAEISRRKGGGKLQVEDLPAECRVVSRRVLTQIEALERDAIVQALLDNSRNVARAARDLGMSRATIYRKIHNFGIQPSTLR